MAKIYGTPIMAGGSGGANKDLPPLLDNFKAFEGGVVDDGLTRLKDLPSGSKVKLGKWNGTALQWKLARRAGDNQLRFLLEPDSMNAIGKMTYNVNQNDTDGYPDPGYYPNNMAKSDIQQWLNATGEAGTWYVQPEGTSLKPEYADNKVGFLNQWTNQEINSILNQEWLSIGMNNSIDQLQTNINYESKITLLTDEHLYNNDHALDIFQNEQDQAVGEIYFVSDCWRVVFYGNSIGVSGMSSSSARPMNEPTFIRPICAPNPEAVVSDEPDGDGCYTIDYTKRTVGDLQVGDKIKVSVIADAQSFLGENIVFQVAAHNHPTHPENSATLITEKIIACMAVDAAETSYPNGNPDYSLSNLNQWLNSNAGAGQWWSATHDGDVAPAEPSVDYNPYSQRAGFLNMLDGGFVKSLLETHRVQPQFDDVIKSETNAKVFNISLFECGGYVSGASGVSYQVMPLFEPGNSARLAYLTQAAISNSEFDTNRNPSGRDYSHYWWCCDQYSSYNIAAVRYDGSVTSSPAASPNTGDFGIRPACNISNSLPLVSDTPDEDGCYLVDWNKINVTIQADKMLESRANELAGAVWVYGDHEPESVNDGTKIQLSRDEVVDSGSTGTENQTVSKTIQWNDESDFFARQFTYNSKKQYQTMLEGAIATITLVGVPEPVSELAETHSGSSITLTWKNPASDELYDHTVVVYKTDAFPTTIDDGTQGYTGTDETATLSDLELGSTYYIAVFTVSADGLYGVPQTVQVEIPAGQLLSSLASGTKVKLGKWNNTDLQWKVAKDTSDQSIRLVLEPTSVSLLGNMQYDAPEPSNSDSSRRSYGNNRYIYSNIHQWLNATKVSGWYTAQHSADAAPAYASSPGFLSGWSENHIAALDRATLTTSRASIDGGGTETFVARVALISTTELGLESETGGGRLDIFNSDGDRATGAVYFTRTPHPSYSTGVRNVAATGALYVNNYNASHADRVRPICTPVSTALVSLEMDDDNCYVVQ